MNSRVGVGALTGRHSGNVLGYDSRLRDCHICRDAEKKCAVAKANDCRKNWEKSSKAMEPDIVISVTKDSQGNGIQLATMMPFGDAATIKRVREEADADIDKWADLSHTKKNFGSKLDSAKTQHPELKNSKVTALVTKCFVDSIKCC